MNHTVRRGNASSRGRRRERAMTERFYFAQCLKDETMAESIARAMRARAGRGGPVVASTGRSTATSAPARPSARGAGCRGRP